MCRLREKPIGEGCAEGASRQAHRAKGVLCSTVSRSPGGVF